MMEETDTGGTAGFASGRADCRALRTGATTDEVIAQFRQLFTERPETAAALSAASDLDAAAVLMERIGASHGIATNAAELRGFVRRLRTEMSVQSELTVSDLKTINGGGVADAESEFDLTLMMTYLGFQKAETPEGS